MKIRKKTLWAVPVYCLVSSYISFYLTVIIGSRFYVVKSLDASGVIHAEIDPVRADILNIALFLLVLVVGGILLRRMTKKEVAASAGIASAFYLLAVLCQLLIPAFPLKLSVLLAYVQNWTGSLSAFLMKLGLGLHPSVIAASFAPMLFIPFGRKEAADEP